MVLKTGLLFVSHVLMNRQKPERANNFRDPTSNNVTILKYTGSIDGRLRTINNNLFVSNVRT